MMAAIALRQVTVTVAAFIALVDTRVTIDIREVAGFDLTVHWLWFK
jgi:hypothetical protein